MPIYNVSLSDERREWNRKYKEDKWFPDGLISFNEHFLVPFQIKITFLSVWRMLSASQPPLLLRMWHMWQLRGKQGVEPPTRWDPGLFATFRQSWRRWGSPHPARQPAEFLSFYLSGKSLVWSGRAVQIQNHGQILRRAGYKEEGISAPPSVDSTTCFMQ